MGQAVVTVKMTPHEFDNLRGAIKFAMASTREEGIRLQKEIEDPSTDPRTVHSAKELAHMGRSNYRMWEALLRGPLA